MAQTSVIVAALAMLGAVGGLVYLHASRDGNETGPSAALPSSAQIAPSPRDTPSVAPTTPTDGDAPESAHTQPSSPRQPEPDDVARWVTDTQSHDSTTRAAAIEALANAPKAQAVPALERVLESGEPQVDRQMALRSLHTLALHDGDENGAIRDVIRNAMYHSEDEGVTQSAQAVLEDIEAEFAERTQLN